MSNSRVMSTAELLNDVAPLADSRLLPYSPGAGSSRLLNWIVALTERAQRHLERVAQAEAQFVRPASEGQSRFVNDAAGGGFRALEAAGGARTQAEPR
jgi:hypothetical protein